MSGRHAFCLTFLEVNPNDFKVFETYLFVESFSFRNNPEPDSSYQNLGSESGSELCQCGSSTMTVIKNTEFVCMDSKYIFTMKVCQKIDAVYEGHKNKISMKSWKV